MFFKKFAKNLLNQPVKPSDPEAASTNFLETDRRNLSQDDFTSAYSQASSLDSDPEIKEALLDELLEPETVIGENVKMKGELSFERLLRIDGTFEGELISDGKLIVGPKGVVKASIQLQEAYISGKVEGDIHVKDKLILRGRAEVRGDITASLISVDEGVAIIGHVTVSGCVGRSTETDHEAAQNVNPYSDLGKDSLSTIPQDFNV